MTQRITIDPITRLEGHGKIEIFLNEDGDVANTYFQIPELRGFERFCVGRPVEEMPLLTNRICGVCPEAHHMAAAKAADAVYHVDPPRAAKLLRELLYSAQRRKAIRSGAPNGWRVAGEPAARPRSRR
ncbi:MAG: nickel-dependent hydrogenase large subunit, partial [Chloroflexi bacterium]|nr:nickel-dependent hydrogenase large subunit [Chloroflexota bacterium]